MRHCAAFSPFSLGSRRADVQNQLFEAALGIVRPWYVRGVDFDAGRKTLTIRVDFVSGSRFPAPRACIRFTTPDQTAAASQFFPT
jgi:hypothetical protein